MATASPAGRVLALLERLQERPGVTGPRLAREIGVSERTIRRYVATLQDLGIPVEPTRGRSGGYRLRPGYRMPPLMLSTDEAVAMTLALAAMRRPAAPELTEPTEPTGRVGDADESAAATALAKLVRVLPRDVATRVAQVLTAVSAPMESAALGGPAPNPGLLAAIAEGVVGRRRCRLRHRSQQGSVTVREVNPYGVAAVHGGWYLHAWCHLRQARRTFRIDRIDRVDLLAKRFSAPEGLDVVAAVEESLALARPEWSVTLLVHAPREDVEGWVPRHLGVLESLDSETTRLRSSTSNLDYFAWRISDLPFALTVVAPDELRGAFERHALRMLEVARGYASQHD
ncbi:MAG: YafY family transcriptional regulator [Actinomycetota bacterium]|jgi:predicted DNA-binding transcriptional regulator YafY|nr:YafY family transcriptional regulator [Actinomycetota bacterium]